MTVRFAVKWAIKAVTPPILVLAAKLIAIRLGLLRAPEAPAAPAAPDAAAAEEGPPEWEYVPEGWERQTDPAVKGWNVEGVVEAYRAKWPSYVRALEGPNPLGVYHEVVEGETVEAHDHGAHNMLVSFAYVLALAAHGKDELSFLDWGGGIGHYYVLARAVLPSVQIDYHCKDVPKLCEYGRELHPEATFHDDGSWRERRYDLVMASGSLQYAEDWRGAFRELARATDGYLYVTRLPVALSSASFVVLQRAYRYGYGTEYLGWVLNRDELLACAADLGLELVREFLLMAWFSAAGAPEEPVEHRGFLFRPRHD